MLHLAFRILLQDTTPFRVHSKKCVLGKVGDVVKKSREQGF